MGWLFGKKKDALYRGDAPASAPGIDGLEPTSYQGSGTDPATVWGPVPPGDPHQTSVVPPAYATPTVDAQPVRKDEVANARPVIPRVAFREPVDTCPVAQARADAGRPPSQGLRAGDRTGPRARRQSAQAGRPVRLTTPSDSHVVATGATVLPGAASQVACWVTAPESEITYNAYSEVSDMSPISEPHSGHVSGVFATSSMRSMVVARPQTGRLCRGRGGNLGRSDPR